MASYLDNAGLRYFWSSKIKPLITGLSTRTTTLETKMAAVESVLATLLTEQTMYDKIDDTVATFVQDSSGNAIEGRIIFQIKGENQ